MSSPLEVVAAIRDQKERDAEQRIKQTLLLCDLSTIALPALYNAAAAGNVTCKAAVQKIENILLNEK